MRGFALNNDNVLYYAIDFQWDSNSYTCTNKHELIADQTIHTN